MFSARVSAFAAKAGLVGGPVLFFLMVFTFDDPVQSCVDASENASLF